MAVIPDKLAARIVTLLDGYCDYLRAEIEAYTPATSREHASIVRRARRILWEAASLEVRLRRARSKPKP